MVGILRRLFGGGDKRALKFSGRHPQDPALLEYFRAGSDTPSGVFVDHNTSLRFSTVYACIRNIAEDTAKLPLILYQRLPRGRRRAVEHPLYQLLHDEPNEKMGSMSFRESQMSWALRWGNGYAEIQRDRGGRPAALHLLEADRLKPELTADDRIVYVPWSGDVLASSDVLHIRAMGGNEVEGWSVVKMARESIGSAMAAENYGARFWANNARGGGQFVIPGAPGKEELEDLRAKITASYAGSENAFRPKIMWGGMEWKADESIPNDDAQFIATRQFGVEDIARWYRMPPHKIQHLLRSTNNNIEHQGLEYVTDTLMSWFVRVEQEYNRKLLSPDERRMGLFSEHLVTALLRGDMKSRAEFHSKMFQVGAVSPNDVAEIENLEITGPEGDQRYVPVTMQPLALAADPDEEPVDEPEDDEPDADDAGTDRNVKMLDRLVRGHVMLLGQSLQRVMKIQADRVKDKRGTKNFCEWLDGFQAEYPAHVRSAIGGVIDAAADAIWPLVTDEWDKAADATDLMHFTAEVAREHCRLIDPSSNGDIEVRARREAEDIIGQLVTRIRARPCASA